MKNQDNNATIVGEGNVPANPQPVWSFGKVAAAGFLLVYLAVSIVPTHEYLHCASSWATGGGDCDVTYYNDVQKHDGVRIGGTEAGNDLDHYWIWPVGILAFTSAIIVMRQPKSLGQERRARRQVAAIAVGATAIVAVLLYAIFA